MSGFSPCVPIAPFSGVGGREERSKSEDNNAAPNAPSSDGPASGFQAGAFRGFRNTYDNNPIGCLQERMQKQGITPVYVLLNTRGYDHSRFFTTQVTLPNGLQAVGTGSTKKLSKHNAARAMLDILDGRAAAVTEKVSQSITDGLKALRGDHGEEEENSEKSGSSDSREQSNHGGKTFKPQFVCKKSEQEFLENQKKHQQEILQQSIEYGPLGVKLWFTGENKDKEISCSREPNRPPPDPIFSPTDDERLECVAKGQFFIKGPIHNETMEDYLEKLIFESAWLEILKRSGQQENVCKLCNLVFINKKYYDEHKYTDDHLHVCKGFFPGKGGYHCFLCWISFNQPEGLLNHVSRPNHQKRADKKGVAKIWMEPVCTNSWDLINVHKHLEDCRREDESRDWKTRDEARKDKERNRDKKRKRSRSPSKWSHDKFDESSSHSSKRKLASDYYKWREVKDEKRRERKSSRDEYRGERERGSREDSRYREDSREDHRYREDGRYSSRTEEFRDDYSHRREDTSHGKEYTSHGRDERFREERDRGYRDSHLLSSSDYREESSKCDLRDILRRKRETSVADDIEEGEIRPSSLKHKKKAKKKKSKRTSELSDHEEVNEIQEDFEIDSVGQVENSEETLQKMKSAIIGILDDEIFALNKKNKK